MADRLRFDPRLCSLDACLMEAIAARDEGDVRYALALEALAAVRKTNASMTRMLGTALVHDLCNPGAAGLFPREEGR